MTGLSYTYHREGRKMGRKDKLFQVLEVFQDDKDDHRWSGK